MGPDISIHAPARGATIVSVCMSISPAISIHAPARGATPHHSVWIILGLFQSTLPRGERPSGGRIQRSKGHNFNPRSREGSDCPFAAVAGLPVHFNPRSREGSDDVTGRFYSYLNTDFNPRSREGSDLRLHCTKQATGYFNPRSREGSDCSVRQGWPIYNLFQSTLPRGERLRKR